MTVLEFPLCALRRTTVGGRMTRTSHEGHNPISGGSSAALKAQRELGILQPAALSGRLESAFAKASPPGLYSSKSWACS